MGSKLVRKAEKFRAKGKLLGLDSVEVKVNNNKEAIAYTDNEKITRCIIPDFVTKIKASGFVRCNNLTEVAIPDSVTEIGDRAFLNCVNLKKVIVGKNVKTIGIEAFMNCTKLEQVEFTGNTTLIKDYAFKSCGITRIVLPDSVKIIGAMAFNGCSGLREFKVPLGVKTLQCQVLAMCKNLEHVELHDKLVKIGDRALECTNLDHLDIPKSVKNIDRNAFNRCNRINMFKWGGAVLCNCSQ